MKAMAAPVSEMAEPLLEQTCKRVTKRADHVVGLSTPQLHALRLDVKQMRYGTEFFGAIYGAKKVKKFRSKLTTMQEILGQLQDAAVAEARLMALAPELSKDGMIAVGLVSGWFGARADYRLEGIEDAMHTFIDQKVFWK